MIARTPVARVCRKWMPAGGGLFAHAVSDLGRHAHTCFSTEALLDGLYASQTVAEDQFKWAMTSLMCQLRLCLNVAVAMGR